jgi:hypothetical protein
MEVQIGSGGGSSELVIRSLSKDYLSFVWFDTAYNCTHALPPGDTAETRAAAAAELQKQKQGFFGKWTTASGKEYVEFLSNDVCIHGTLQGGHWVTTHDQSNVAHEGADASCGGNGAYSHQGPNVIVLDYGMGGDVTKYYRNPQSAPKMPPLTLALAQRLLDQQINIPTAQNTLFTCHACYDPSDKEDNDKAPLVNTYSTALDQFLMNRGYIRISGGRQVFTARAKQSKYYEPDESGAGFRFATFKNASIIGARIIDSSHVPIEYEFVPTELTTALFGKTQRVKAIASFSYDNETWNLCIACRH